MRQGNDVITTQSEGWTHEETLSWVHIVPLNDMAFHTLSSLCRCQPLPRDFTSGEKRLLLHFAFDGRQYQAVDAIEPIQFDLPPAIDVVNFSRSWQ